MFYKVVESFGPESGDVWEIYLDGHHSKAMTSCDSIDASLRGDCFNPETSEDWLNCIGENFKCNILTNLEYAKLVAQKYKDAIIVGIDMDVASDYIPEANLAGYDILDEFCATSLITNWQIDGAEVEGVDFQRNGLIADLQAALATKDRLRSLYPNDFHAKRCQVWAIYNVEP